MRIQIDSYEEGTFFRPTTDPIGVSEHGVPVVVEIDDAMYDRWCAAKADYERFEREADELITQAFAIAVTRGTASEDVKQLFRKRTKPLGTVPRKW